MNAKAKTSSSKGKSSKELPAAKSGEFRIGGDLPVWRLGFGAMRITGKGVWGPPKDHDEAIRVLRRAIELGINFIDTADSYGPHVSEQLIAEALHPYPKSLVIATKAGFDRSGPDRWTMNGRPEHLREACDGSLKRSEARAHRFVSAAPHRSRLPGGRPARHAARTLQEQGKIRHIGLSEVSVAQIEHARKIVPIVSVQNRYSLTDRAAEDVLDYCERENIGFIPWFPLGAGDLAAPGGKLARTAEEMKITTSQLALAWLLWRSPVMLPIPGTSRVSHLEENVATAAVKPDDAKMRLLGQLAKSA